jgi:hypothetical protein
MLDRRNIGRLLNLAADMIHEHPAAAAFLARQLAMVAALADEERREEIEIEERNRRAAGYR